MGLSTLPCHRTSACTYALSDAASGSGPRRRLGGPCAAGTGPADVGPRCFCVSYLKGLPPAFGGRCCSPRRFARCQQDRSSSITRPHSFPTGGVFREWTRPHGWLCGSCCRPPLCLVLPLRGSHDPCAGARDLEACVWRHDWRWGGWPRRERRRDTRAAVRKDPLGLVNEAVGDTGRLSALPQDKLVSLSASGRWTAGHLHGCQPSTPRTTTRYPSWGPQGGREYRARQHASAGQVRAAVGIRASEAPLARLPAINLRASGHPVSATVAAEPHQSKRYVQAPACPIRFCNRPSFILHGRCCAVRSRAMDLLVFIHPWASSRSGELTEVFPTIRGAASFLPAYPIFLNWRTLVDAEGAVIVYPPDGYVVRVLELPVVREEVLRVDLHLLSQAQNSSLKSNCLWLSMPLPAARTLNASSQTLFKANEHAHSTCGIEIMSLEGVSGHSVDVLKAESRRKSVPYRLGSSGRAGRAAAATPLDNGAWACRVGLGYLNLYEGTTGAALFAPFCESPTSAVAMSRKGHRLAAVDRAVRSACEAVSAFWAAELAFYGSRRAGRA